MITEKSGFNHKYNTDDVLIRTIIVGLINSLNGKISINNIESDTVTNVIQVPFYYAFSGDERFIQDYFIDWGDCKPNMIEGNYDPIPRGSLSLTGTSVLSGQMTSRFVRGFYTKEEEGQLNRYNSYLNSIPLSMNFTVTVLVDSVIDSFKITQELIKIFYKTLVYRVNYGGTVVPVQVGFPESYTNTKLFDYTYGENSRTTITFDLELETFYPIFDPKQEMHAQSTIQHTQINVSTVSTSPTDLGNPLDLTQQSLDNQIVNDGVTFTAPFTESSTIPSQNQKFGEGYWE